MRHLCLPILLGWSCGPKAPSQTGAVQAPVTSTHVLRVAPAIVEPAGLSGLMGGYFDVHLRVQAHAMPDGSVTLELGSATGDGQPVTCGATTVLPGPPTEPGAFVRLHPGLPLHADGTDFQLHAVRLAGQLDGGQLVLEQAEGTVDSADFVSLVGQSDPMALCTFAADNVPCGPCPHTEQDRCWRVQLGPTTVPAWAAPDRPEAATQSPHGLATSAAPLPSEACPP